MVVVVGEEGIVGGGRHVGVVVVVRMFVVVGVGVGGGGGGRSGTVIWHLMWGGRAGRGGD